jgi:hypothetical protein
LARFWKTAVLVVTTAYFVVDGVLSYVTRPITVWITERNLFERVRLWIVSLRPFPALALLVVPVIILEPAKPLAGFALDSLASIQASSFPSIPLVLQVKPPWCCL